MFKFRILANNLNQVLVITCFVVDVNMCYFCDLFQACQLLLFTKLHVTVKKCIKNAC